MSYRLLALAEQLNGAMMRQVFTHTSWAAERASSYERLEFLGDSVLSLCITTELYRRFPDFAEGHLARLRAYIVSRATCARVATKLGLGKMLREQAGTGREAGDVAQLQGNENVLADLTEALIGAVYVTFGFEAVRPAVVEVFEEHVQYAESSYIDHKTELQEYLARSGQSVSYSVLGYSGPPHNREFEIVASVEGETLGRGFGTSKKRAEQEAAAEALSELQTRTRRTSRRARLRGRRPRPPAAQGDLSDVPGEEAPGDGGPGGTPPGGGRPEETLPSSGPAGGDRARRGGRVGADGAAGGPPRPQPKKGD